MKNFKSGFSLVELLVVITILSILASIAIPFYKKYIDREKLRNYAIPVVRKCLLDLATYCAENPAPTSSGTSLNINTTYGPSCLDKVNTSAGEVDIDNTKSVTCGQEGYLINSSKVEATMNGKKVACEIINESEIKCYTVE